MIPLSLLLPLLLSYLSLFCCCVSLLFCAVSLWTRRTVHSLPFCSTLLWADNVFLALYFPHLNFMQSVLCWILTLLDMLCKKWTQDFTWDLVEACRAQQLLGRFAASGMQVTRMEVAADVQVTAQRCMLTVRWLYALASDPVCWPAASLFSPL